MKQKVTLHIYWDDGVTAELRYYPTKKMAEKYATDNGYDNYLID